MVNTTSTEHTRHILILSIFEMDCFRDARNKRQISNTAIFMVKDKVKLSSTSGLSVALFIYLFHGNKILNIVISMLCFELENVHKRLLIFKYYHIFRNNMVRKD